MHSVVIMINPYEMSQASHLAYYEGGQTATSGRLHAPAMVISWSEANYAGGEQTKNNQVKHRHAADRCQKADRRRPGLGAVACLALIKFPANRSQGKLIFILLSQNDS